MTGTLADGNGREPCRKTLAGGLRLLPVLVSLRPVLRLYRRVKLRVGGLAGDDDLALPHHLRQPVADASENLVDLLHKLTTSLAGWLDSYLTPSYLGSRSRPGSAAPVVGCSRISPANSVIWPCKVGDANRERAECEKRHPRPRRSHTLTIRVPFQFL